MDRFISLWEIVATGAEILRGKKYQTLPGAQADKNTVTDAMYSRVAADLHQGISNAAPALKWVVVDPDTGRPVLSDSAAVEGMALLKHMAGALVRGIKRAAGGTTAEPGTGHDQDIFRLQSIGFDYQDVQIVLINCNLADVAYAVEGMEILRHSRFTIDDAADTLSKRSGLDFRRWTQNIVEAVLSGDLPARNPVDLHDSLPYTPSRIDGYDYPIRTYYEQVDTAGLNAWLDRHPEWRVSWRFPDPQHNDAGPTSKQEPAMPKQAIDWKQRCRDHATEWCLDRLAHGLGKATKVAVAKEVAAWCRNEGIMAERGRAPTEKYISRHVLDRWIHPVRE